MIPWSIGFSRSFQGIFQPLSHSNISNTTTRVGLDTKGHEFQCGKVGHVGMLTKQTVFPQVWFGWMSSRTEEKKDQKERIPPVATGATLTVTISASTTTATTCIPTMNQ